MVYRKISIQFVSDVDGFLFCVAAQAGASEVALYLVSEKSLNCDINILDSGTSHKSPIYELYILSNINLPPLCPS